MRDRTLGFRLPRGPAESVYTEQVEANRSSRLHAEAFAPHRARMTSLLVERAPPSGAGSLCILGAGNANDLDVPRLLQAFAAIHLVDLDKPALVGARARLPEALRPRIKLHAPVDLSGLLARLSDWKELRLGPEALARWPQTAAQDIAKRVGQSFDVVASSCLLSQMQLGVLQALGDRHPLFQVARHTVNVVHLRTMLRLLEPGGRGLLATDVASDADGDFPVAAAEEDLRPWLSAPTLETRLFDSVHPQTIAQTFADDPVLSQAGILSPPLAAWLWSHGPARTFLVYAAAIERTRGPEATPPL